jgi:two-component system response regulator YesN
VLDPNTPNGLVKRIDNFIRENALNKTLNLPVICEQFSISRSYLSHLLRTELNTTPIKLRTQYRIEKAKHLLATTDDPIYLIAEQCGYRNHRRFAEAFHKHINMRPTDYRKICRQKRTD